MWGVIMTLGRSYRSELAGNGSGSVTSRIASRRPFAHSISSAAVSRTAPRAVLMTVVPSLSRASSGAPMR